MGRSKSSELSLKTFDEFQIVVVLGRHPWLPAPTRFAFRSVAEIDSIEAMATIRDRKNSNFTLIVTTRSPEDFGEYDDPESAAEALKADSTFSFEDQCLRQEAAMALASLPNYYLSADKIAGLLPALRNGYRAAAMVTGVQIDRLPSDVFIDACVSRFVEELLGDNGGVLAAEIAELFETVSAVYARAIVCQPPEQ